MLSSSNSPQTLLIRHLVESKDPTFPTDSFKAMALDYRYLIHYFTLFRDFPESLRYMQHLHTTTEQTEEFIRQNLSIGSDQAEYDFVVFFIF